MRNKLTSFFFSRQGSALVEFSLLAPVFIAFLIGVLQIGCLVILKNALEQGAYEGARYASMMPLATGNQNAVKAKALNAFDQLSFGLLSRDDVTVQVNTYPLSGSTLSYIRLTLRADYKNMFTYVYRAANFSLSGMASAMVVNYVDAI